MTPVKPWPPPPEPLPPPPGGSYREPGLVTRGEHESLSRLVVAVDRSVDDLATELRRIDARIESESRILRGVVVLVLLSLLFAMTGHCAGVSAMAQPSTTPPTLSEATSQVARPPAEGQGALSPRATYQRARLGRDAALWSARACVGETGWTHLDGCTAIIGVHARRAARAGLTIATMTRLYSHAIRYPRRAWVPQLADTPHAPPAWPDVRTWTRSRARFARMLEHASRVLAGLVKDPCPSEVLHHGGPDGVDEDLHGWTEVECVEGTAQRFYARAT